jgi:cardiolipin synthase
VRLFEYPLGLLHTKAVTVDGRITLVGSANMDRRSLELNFEDNLLVLDPGVTATVRDRQLGYVSQSTIVKADSVENWPLRARLLDNAIAMASPVL